MRWSSLGAFSYLASVFIGCAIGGSILPPWSFYVGVFLLMLLPVFFIRNFEPGLRPIKKIIKELFTGIPPFIWGVFFVSILSLLLNFGGDGLKPIFQSLIAAFVFYVIDIVYPKNKSWFSVYPIARIKLGNIYDSYVILIQSICDTNGGDINDLKDFMNHYATLTDGLSMAGVPLLKSEYLGVMERVRGKREVYQSFSEAIRTEILDNNRKIDEFISLFGPYISSFPEIHFILAKLHQSSLVVESRFECNGFFDSFDNRKMAEAFINYTEYMIELKSQIDYQDKLVGCP